MMNRTDATNNKRWFLVGVLICFLFMVNVLTTQAQLSPFQFESIGKTEGLSQVTINDIYQDRYGFLWFATQEGLNRYDGYEFRVYKNNPTDTLSLSHSWVWHIQEDTLGYLWLGCWIGLNRFDPKTGKTTRFFYNPSDPNSLPGSRINYLERDLSGRIWISCWGAGLSLLKSFDGRFQSVMIMDNAMDTVNHIRCMTPSNDGDLWVGSWGKGVWEIHEDQTGRFNAIQILPDHPVLSVAQITTLIENDRKLYIATEGAGTWIYFLDERKAVNVNNYIHGISLPDNIYRIAFWGELLLLGSMIDGFWILDLEQGTADQYLHDPREQGSLNSNTVFSIYIDNQEIIWLGTQGINKYDPGKNKFHWYHHVRNDPNSLSHDDVFSFCEDDKGQIWIGKKDHLLTCFDPENKKMIHFPLANDHNQVKLVTAISWQAPWLWIGTEGNGLIKFHPENHTVEFLTDQSKVLKPITRITCLEWLHPDTLIIGTDGQGLVKYFPGSDSAIFYRFNRHDTRTIGYDVINCLLKDRHGRLWLGTWGGGLNVFDPGNNHFIRYNYRSDYPNTISSDIVYDILEDDAGNLWIATGNGLNYYDQFKQEFSHFYESDGLPGNMVNKILSDQLGNLWVSTNYGVSQFNLRDSIFINYTPAEGLQGYEFNSGVGLASSRGLFYLGGTQGFNEFDPVSIQQHHTGGPVVFTSIKIFQETMQGIDYNDQQLSLNLPYDRDFLSFEFVALNYAGEIRNRYTYRMVGLDEDWIYAGKRRYANYTGMNPGDYTFQVGLTQGIKVEEETVRSIAIRINPPFWETWWFITIILIIFFLLLYTFHRYRISRVLTLANLRNKIATDLHDDVGSSLTKISIYSGLMQANPDPHSSKNYLEKISMLSREVISTMSDIVWSIDTKNDEWHDLIDRMRDFIWEIGSMKNIKVDFTHEGIPVHRKMNLVLRQNLYLIFKEAVNNAMKYSEATRIEVHIQVTDHQLELKITDNGKGFDPLQAKGNGLVNMQKRAQRIRGKLSIQTDRGTAIRLYIPLN